MAYRPDVTVLIRSYNAAAFLPESVGSVLAQTHRTLEVIVVDDGSTDSTTEVLEQIAERDVRVRIAKQPRNLGLAATMNRGLDEAQTRWVVILDADDIEHPYGIERQLELAR